MQDWIGLTMEFLRHYQLFGVIIGLVLSSSGYLLKRTIENKKANESLDLYRKILQFNEQTTRLYFAKKYLDKDLIELIKRDIDPLLIQSCFEILYLSYSSYQHIYTLNSYDSELLEKDEFERFCESYSLKFHISYTFLKIVKSKGYNRQEELVEELKKIEPFVKYIPKPKNSTTIDEWEKLYL